MNPRSCPSVRRGRRPRARTRGTPRLGSAAARPRAPARDPGAPRRSRRPRRPRRRRASAACTRSRRPAGCDGSTTTGRCVSRFSTGTAVMSSVLRVEVSKVWIPRSQSITWWFPPRTMYSAAIGAIPRSSPTARAFNMTGSSARPTSSSSAKFCMFRAPIWITSALLDESVDVAHIHQLGDDRQPGRLARPRRASSSPRLPVALEAYGTSAA